MWLPEFHMRRRELCLGRDRNWRRFKTDKPGSTARSSRAIAPTGLLDREATTLDPALRSHELHGRRHRARGRLLAPNRPGTAHVAFLVEDIEALAARMLEAGASEQGRIARCTSGCLAVYLTPNGIIVELAELPARADGRGLPGTKRANRKRSWESQSRSRSCS
jgi:hypothetical protein